MLTQSGWAAPGVEKVRGDPRLLGVLPLLFAEPPRCARPRLDAEDAEVSRAWPCPPEPPAQPREPWGLGEATTHLHLLLLGLVERLP